LQEILSELPPNSLVLDLGCDQGSFDSSAFPRCLCIRVDLEKPHGDESALFVQADAAKLPFRNAVFDAVICNHSLEHFPELEHSLSEIGRSLKPTGAFFASVPDSSSITDKFYRWLGKGGGHVNQIANVREFVAKVESQTHLRCCGVRVLLTSLSFLNCKSPTARPMRTMVELGVNFEPLLAVLTWFMRNFDRVFGTRMSLSGWLLYFGTIAKRIDEQTWGNMCVRCGSAHSSTYLLRSGVVVKWTVPRRYHCPSCGATNLFTPDNAVQGIR